MRLLLGRILRLFLVICVALLIGLAALGVYALLATNGVWW